MILIKGFTGFSTIERIFKDEDKNKAFEYYKELAAQGIAVQYTNMKEQSQDEYLDSLLVKLKELYK